MNARLSHIYQIFQASAAISVIMMLLDKLTAASHFAPSVGCDTYAPIIFHSTSSVTIRHILTLVSPNMVQLVQFDQQFQKQV